MEASEVRMGIAWSTGLVEEVEEEMCGEGRGGIAGEEEGEEEEEGGEEDKVEVSEGENEGE